jgi:hypothetical protein
VQAGSRILPERLGSPAIARSLARPIRAKAGQAAPPDDDVDRFGDRALAKAREVPLGF